MNAPAVEIRCQAQWEPLFRMIQKLGSRSRLERHALLRTLMEIRALPEAR